MAIQKKTFKNNQGESIGFVLHKLPVGIAKRASAWFDKEGNIQEALLWTTNNRTRNIKRDSSNWQECQTLGRNWLTRDDR